MVSKTDGVPLFIEELTKMLLESGLLEERGDRYELTGPLPPLAIPNTLQDSLMARLDRLAAVKVWHSSGRLWGASSVIHCCKPSPRGPTKPSRGSRTTGGRRVPVRAGPPPQATYRFKHALIQEAAYQSLLKSTRQQHHQRIADTLESRFPEIVETRPELLAHHYTEAGLAAQAILYWQTAGRRALQRSANREAASHAARGLELLSTLPETPELAKHELSLQLTLGGASGFVTGPQSVEHVYARACELARQVGSTLELFPALSGLAHSEMVLGHMHEARALSEEFLELARRQDDPLILAVGHSMLAYTAWWQGDFIDVRDHSRHSLALYARSSTAPVLCPMTRTTASFPDISPHSAIGCWDTRLRRSRRWRTRSRTPVSSTIRTVSGYRFCSSPNCLSFVASPSPPRHERKRLWQWLRSTAFPHWNCGVCCPGVGPPLIGAMSVRGSLISMSRWTADGRSAWGRCGLGFFALLGRSEGVARTGRRRAVLAGRGARIGWSATTSVCTRPKCTGSRASCCSAGHA